MELYKMSDFPISGWLMSIDRDYLLSHNMITLTFPDEITLIYDQACRELPDVRKIVLPKNLKVIGNSAFKGCASLEEIIFNKKLKRIEWNAFVNLPRLKKIEFPENLKDIYSDAFRDCTSLEEIILPKNLKYMGSGAFENCTSLKKVIFKGNPPYGHEAFKGCTSLETIELFGKNDNLVSLFCPPIKEIIFHQRVNQKNVFIFEHNSNVERIIFNYNTYSDLLNILKFLERYSEYKEKSYYIKRNYGNKTIEFVLKGPVLNLNSNQISRIKKIFNFNNYNNINQDKISFINTNKENIQEKKYTKIKELQKVIDKINSMCNKLPEESKNIILNKVNELIDKYYKEIYNLKPKYDSINDISLNDHHHLKNYMQN